MDYSEIQPTESCRPVSTDKLPRNTCVMHECTQGYAACSLKPCTIEHCNRNFFMSLRS